MLSYICMYNYVCMIHTHIYNHIYIYIHIILLVYIYNMCVCYRVHKRLCIICLEDSLHRNIPKRFTLGAKFDAVSQYFLHIFGSSIRWCAMSILKLNSEHWVCPEVGMPLSRAVLAEPLPLGTWSTGTMQWFPYKVMWRGCINQQGGWEMGGCWNSGGNVASWWMLVFLGSEVFLSFEDLGHPLLAWHCNRTFSCCLLGGSWRRTDKCLSHDIACHDASCTSPCQVKRCQTKLWPQSGRAKRGDFNFGKVSRTNSFHLLSGSSKFWVL